MFVCNNELYNKLCCLWYELCSSLSTLQCLQHMTAVPENKTVKKRRHREEPLLAENESCQAMETIIGRWVFSIKTSAAMITCKACYSVQDMIGLLFHFSIVGCTTQKILFKPLQQQSVLHHRMCIGYILCFCLMKTW